MAGGLETALPWWMGAFIVVVWLAVVGGIVAIAVRRRRRSAARARTDHAGTPARGLPDGTRTPAELGPGPTTEFRKS